MDPRIDKVIQYSARPILNGKRSWIDRLFFFTIFSPEENFIVQWKQEVNLLDKSRYWKNVSLISLRLYLEN